MAIRSVALCITDLDIGGAEQALTELAVRLDRSRFLPVVYCLSARPESEEASCVARLEQAGVEVHFLGGRGKFHLPRILRRLTALFVLQKPHLVQSFLFHANLVSRMAARMTSIRPVVSGIRVAERERRWHLILDRLTTQWVDRYVCVSQSVADFSVKEGRLPPDKMAVIPNGIDVTAYPSAHPADLRPLGIAQDRKVVTYVGRLEAQKGLHWLLDSAPEWLGRTKDCDLLLVGKGPERAKLEWMVESSGLTSRVRFAGWRADVPQILAASSLLVLPSRWEGMPNVVLQAMASRLPVVATDVEGVRELLGPNTDAQTVRYGDTPALAKRIARLLWDSRQADELGQRNRGRAEKTFTLERMVSAYQDLWESITTTDFPT